jgi:hypothetical protein
MLKVALSVAEKYLYDYIAPSCPESFLGTFRHYPNCEISKVEDSAACSSMNVCSACASSSNLAREEHGWISYARPCVPYFKRIPEAHPGLGAALLP